MKHITAVSKRTPAQGALVLGLLAAIISGVTGLFGGGLIPWAIRQQPGWYGLNQKGDFVPR